MDSEEVARVARLELSALLHAGVVHESLEKSKLGPLTPIHDIDGDVIYYRGQISSGTASASVDTSLHPVFGQPILAIGHRQKWSQGDILKQAASIAESKHGLGKWETTRFVAYSYPKIAVQFLENGKELLMLELGSWAKVPQERKRASGEPPGNFERWSLLEEASESRLRANRKALDGRLAAWEDIIAPGKVERGPAGVISKSLFPPIPFPVVFSESRELHYGTFDSDHHPCYELRGQETSVWCVAASVEMVLDFYRYNYPQTKIASALGLGTLASPNGLPYSRVGDVVTQLQALLSNALTAKMNTSPNFYEFASEISANRPLVSFIWGHSRTVAGFTFTWALGRFTYRGLLVYDPWPPSAQPPNGGVITRWENFDAMNNANKYMMTYTAHLTLT